MTPTARTALAADDVLAFDGYREGSLTLEAAPVVGTCMRSWWSCRRWPTVIKDPAVPCKSGDLVQILIRRRDGEFRSLVKELRCTRDGKWFGCCDDGIFRIGWRGIFWPVAMTRVVALSTGTWGLDHDAPVTGATRAELDRINAMPDVVRAVAEWAEHGVPRGVLFPGLIAINPTDAHRSRMDDNAALLLADLPTDPQDLRNGTGARPVCATVSTPSYDQPIAPTNLTATGLVKGVLLKWQAPQPRNSRQVYHVYQHTANTPFASASRVWSGNALETTIDLAAGVTRYFWVTGELNGQETASVPSGNGVSGTPSPASTPDIADGAATVVLEATDSSASLINGGGNLLDISVPAQGIATYLLTVIGTFDVWITNMVGTPTFQIEVRGNGTLLTTSQVATPTVTSSPGQRITLQASASIALAHEAGTGVVAQLVWTGAAPSGTAEARNITLRAECIKR